MRHQFLHSILLFGFILMMALPGHAQPDSSSVEWIKVYFNMPSDQSVSRANNASNDNADLIGSLEALINSARSSVDLSIYDLEHPRIGRALVRAKQRGVRIRIVTDNYNRHDAGRVDSLMWHMLRESAIISIDGDGDVYMPGGTILDNSLVNAGADMHNKFAVIDALNENPGDDYVWTGSTNLTYTGAYNTNHTIVIKDNSIAQAYVDEFEQMWGSTGDLPNPDRARFHKDKRAVLNEHLFFVGDMRVELYFSPINRRDSKPSIARRLAKLVDKQAQYDINFQAFAISASFPLSRKIWELSSTDDIALNGVIDRSFYGRYEGNGDIWASPEAQLFERMILPSKEMRKLHHKVLFIDAANPDSSDQGVVVTGSYNFSNNAEVNNDENLLIIYSDAITNQFYQDFMGVVSRAQEKTYPPHPPVYTERWYAVDGEIEDGSRIPIEVVPGFEHNVRLLGVDVPSVFAANDSADYYSDVSRKYMKELLEGALVRIEGPYGSKPNARYGSLQAYVTLQKNGKMIGLNRHLLKKGLGQYVSYYPQHPDSVDAFKAYETKAKEAGVGLWENPGKITTKISRSEAMGNSSTSLADLLPININTADSEMLQMLPGIGPVYAERIITYRKKKGSFHSISELENIDGIGPDTMARLRPNVVTEK